MRRKKKSGKQDARTLQVIVLLTAILNFIKAVIELVSRMME